jgi:hypothetical protein
MSQLTFKGDQNLAWDAVPTDYWLVINGYDTRFFIQDEKLGTPDFSIKTDAPYQITTDYCNKYKGIVWIHQDISIGPFYVLPIEPKEFKHWGFHFRHINPDYDRIINKFDLSSSLKELGTNWTLGRLPKALSESENYAGLVPTVDEQRSISSYKLDADLVKTYAMLFLKAYHGALKTVIPEKRCEVGKRARLFHKKAADFISSNPDTTISDLQMFIWEFMWTECFGMSVPEISKASDIFSLTNHEIPNITLTTLLTHPNEFEHAYNIALKNAELPLKRLKMKDNSMELPYFLQCDDDEGLVRWRTKAVFGDDSVSIMFTRGQRVKQFEIKKPLTFDNIAETIGKMPCCVSLIGKAGPLMTELSRPPSTIALPEKGSKYTPMVGFLTRELQSKGINFPSGKILRIGMDALDRLDQVNEDINLPDFLSCFYGKTVNSNWFAQNWRENAARSESILENCRYHPSQLVSVAKFMAHEKENSLPNPLPENLAKLGDIKGISKPLSFGAYSKLKSLMAQRDEILAKRRIEKKNFKEAMELADVTMAISLIVAGVFKRHAQHADLAYLNRRPYALSFWLCFGSQIVESMGRMAIPRIEEC